MSNQTLGFENVESLICRNLIVSSLEIIVHQKSTIVVEMEGDESQLKKVKVFNQDCEVIIEQEESSLEGISISNGGNSISIRGTIRGTTVVSNSRGINVFGGNVNDVYIGGRKINLNDLPEDSSPPTSIKVYVPRKTRIVVSDVSDIVNIGDTEGYVNAHLGGSGTYSFGKIGNLKAKVSGSGNITAKDVQGSLDVKLSGSGNISISDGHLTDCDVSVSGMGDVRINAVAEEADLSVSGMGNISLKRSLRKPYQKVSGMGNIHVSKIG